MNSAVAFGASLSGSDSPSKSIYLKTSSVKASIGSVTFSRLATRSLCCTEVRMAASDSSYLDSAAAEIIVVRHGETEWNADGRIQGHLDGELNDVGRQQAAAVADRLPKGNKISFVYSSDLKRALETGRSIATRCGVMEVIKDSDLGERRLGDLQDLVLREAARDNPEAYRAFLSRDTDKAFPDFNSCLNKCKEGVKVLINSTSVARPVWRILAESTKDSKLLLSLMEVLSDHCTSELVKGLWAKY